MDIPSLPSSPTSSATSGSSMEDSLMNLVSPRVVSHLYLGVGDVAGLGDMVEAGGMAHPGDAMGWVRVAWHINGTRWDG